MASLRFLNYGIRKSYPIYYFKNLQKVSIVSKCFSSSNAEKMMENYTKLKSLIQDNYQPKCKANTEAVYAINQINMNDINVYGFDYDYTLAQYDDSMQEFIYNSALKSLVDYFKFPQDLLSLKYNKDFCIRGLHYDVNRSLLMKVDAFNIIQQGSVYRGLRQLEDDEVSKLFEGRRHIPKHILDQSYRQNQDYDLRQLMDVFSLPEMMLIANVVNYFDEKGLVYDPKVFFNTIQSSVRWVHTSGILYDHVSNNMDRYLVKDSMRDLIGYLKEEGKTLFLITNSGFSFTNTGMKWMAGSDWMEAFDVVVVNAKKPHFFNQGKRPFRQVKGNQEHDLSWERITKLKKGTVYSEGSVDELMSMTEWTPSSVMYFGDQIYNDLADVSFYCGWRTGAVIPELATELHQMNSEQFGRNVVWLQTLERLLERYQLYRDEESRQLIADWLEERVKLKTEVRDIFNPHFGSVFRSHLAPSFFANRLCRIADIYTSSVQNLLNYHSDHFFFPTRASLPHETIVATAYQHPGYDGLVARLLE